jgi:hypothetical protein
MKMLKIHCGKYKGIEGRVLFPSILSNEFFQIFFKKLQNHLILHFFKILCQKYPNFLVGKMTKSVGKKKALIGTGYEVEYC